MSEHITAADAAQVILRRRTIRADFGAWCRYNGYEPAAHHRLIIKKLQDLSEGRIQRLAIFCPPGAAKALALDTPVPTPSGWRNMGELRIGDQVFDEKGIPCNIVRVSPIWKDRTVYAIRTDCGDEIIADEDHEWLVRLCQKRGGHKLKTTRYLCRERSKRPMIKHADALKLPELELPIDPYLLGLWLGDGHSSDPRITAAPDDQAFYRAELQRLGYQTKDTSTPLTFRVLHVRGLFVELGLLFDPFHSTFGKKYIPQRYLRASQSQRLSLLQGLCDSDGTVCRRKGSTTFCSTNRHLADQLRELVRTLGVKAGWSESPAIVNGKHCGLAYKVSFYLANSTRLPRKADLTRDQYRTPGTYIDIEQLPQRRDTICITVDSPSHLFLCGRSMLPTHNSTYASVLFPPWYLANHADASILACAHTTELAKRWGRRVRNIVNDHGIALGVTLSDEAAADRWKLVQGGEYKAAGVGTGIAGYRASILLVDDPVRSRADADSKLEQERQWEWYKADVNPRLKPDARSILIQTRWNLGDLAGRILEEMEHGGDHWEVLSLPAEAEENDPLGRKPGEFLWSEGDYGYADLLREQKASQLPRNWSSLYQQSPTIDSGDYFKAEWLRAYDSAPARDTMMIYGASDYATTEDGGDYTCHLVVGVDPESHIYLLDLWRMQTTPDRWVDAFCDLVRRYKPLDWAEEGGQIKASVGPFLEQRQRERKAYVNREAFPTRGDKARRAQAIRGRLALDGLYVPQHAPWYADFRSELLSFPAGRHDDQVDALGLIGQLLDRMVEGREKKPPKVRHRDGYGDDERPDDFSVLTL